MKPALDDSIRKFLMEQQGVVDYKASLCAAFARGNVGKALNLASNERFENLRTGTVDFMSKVKNLSIAEAMERLHTLLAAPEGEEKAAKKGIDMGQYEDFTDVLIFLFRDFLVYKATGDDSHLIFSDKVSYIRSATETCTYEGIGSMIKDLEIAKNRVNSNVNIDLALELMLLGIKENL